MNTRQLSLNQLPELETHVIREDSGPALETRVCLYRVQSRADAATIATLVSIPGTASCHAAKAVVVAY